MGFATIEDAAVRPARHRSGSRRVRGRRADTARGTGRTRRSRVRRSGTVPAPCSRRGPAVDTSRQPRLRAMAKIAIIGAGSVEFTRNILTDLCSYPELAGTLEFALHDIDGERLGYAERAANQVVGRLDAGHVVSAHPDRTTAFDGADYLINEIQVGGYEATVRDFEIPKRYGLRQTIADTIGIGGIMRGLRTIPVMIEMANEMATLCPDGLLLNYTNPMAMVPWGIYAGSAWPAERTIGVCHSVRDTHEFLAATVGVPEDDIRYVTAGFNHQCFVYTFENRH